MTPDADLVSYELAMLQFRPDVTSEELVNIGVVAYSSELLELSMVTTERYGRLKSVYTDLDGVAFRSLVRGARARASAVSKELRKDRLALDGRPDSITDLLGRIVPPGSANFAWSTVRYGVCQDLDLRAREVFDEYIGRHEQPGVRERVDDERLWKQVVESPELEAVLPHVNKPLEVSSQDYSYRFRASWMNGHLQLAEPISLDYVNPGGMVEQAVRWNGIVHLLSKENEFDLTAIVTDPPRGDRQAIQKYNTATSLLLKTEHVRAVIPASDMGQLEQIIKTDLQLAH